MTDLLPYLPGFAAAYAVQAVGGASPGPAVAMLLGIGTTAGRRAALAATAGIATAGATWALLAALGMGAVLASAEWAVTAIRLAGAAYLGWLAFGAFRGAMRPGAPVAAAPAARGGSAWRHYRMGLTLQLTNPKALVFWIAIAALGPTAGGGAGVVAAFCLGAGVVGFSTHGAWALALSSGPVRRGHAAARRWIDAALGTLFATFAFRLATERT